MEFVRESSDQNLFAEVLNNFCNKYNLTADRPYNDGYIIIKNNNGDTIGEMNCEGYNLLYNLTRLCSFLKYELD